MTRPKMPVEGPGHAEVRQGGKTSHEFVPAQLNL